MSNELNFRGNNPGTGTKWVHISVKYLALQYINAWIRLFHRTMFMVRFKIMMMVALITIFRYLQAQTDHKL